MSADHTGDPEVSIVIPTRNRRRLLARTVASVLCQRDVTLEVVIVDDASEDDSAGALSALRGPVRIITLEHHQGLAHARNAGFRAATAPWIALLDDDDLWAPDKLRDQIDTAELQNREWVYSSLMVFDSRLRPIDVVPAPAADSLLPRLLHRNVLGGGASNICVRAELLQRCGGCDERLSHLADWDLWIRLAAAATPAVCRALHAAYVVHSDSMLATWQGDPEAELDYLAEKHCDLSTAHDVGFDRAAVRRWIAAGHLLGRRRVRAAALQLRNAIRHRSPTDLAWSAASLLPRRALNHTSASLSPPEWLTAQKAEWLGAQQGA